VLTNQAQTVVGRKRGCDIGFTFLEKPAHPFERVALVIDHHDMHPVQLDSDTAAVVLVRS